MTDPCLICYKNLKENEMNYHSSCIKNFFETETEPEFNFHVNDMQNLASQVVRSQITIPGVQAKISLELEKAIGKHQRFTIVGLWGRFILKPPVPQYNRMAEIEHLTMEMGHECGIRMVPHALIRFKDGEFGYLSRRIDRPKSGQKIHMEDMCQLTNRQTDDKYKGSMEKIGQFIRSNANNSILDVIRFYEMALFSFITGNADMHLKNFSLWYPDIKTVELTPAYDMLSTRLLIPESMDPEEMALTINGKKRKLKRKDFNYLGEKIGLNKRQVENTLNRIFSAKDRMLNLIQVSFLTEGQKKEYAELIQSRIERIK